MRVLLTNDDGIDAPGLKALEQSTLHWAAQAGLGPIEITVVAPDRGRSECSHSVTNSADLHISEYASNWYALSGTPVDCVRVALACICPDVDLVLSGINAGANVGIDVLVSGTVAAAREAAIHGKPAMAVSHYRHPDIPRTWAHTPDWMETVLGRFFQSFEKLGLKVGGSREVPFWNVNLPAVDPVEAASPPVEECFVDPVPLQRSGKIIRDADQSGDRTLQQSPIQLSSDFHGRRRTPGSDVSLCFSGSITISRLTVM